MRDKTLHGPLGQARARRASRVGRAFAKPQRTKRVQLCPPNEPLAISASLPAAAALDRAHARPHRIISRSKSVGVSGRADLQAGGEEKSFRNSGFHQCGAPLASAVSIATQTASIKPVRPQQCCQINQVSVSRRLDAAAANSRIRRPANMQSSQPAPPPLATSSRHSGRPFSGLRRRYAACWPHSLVF